MACRREDAFFSAVRAGILGPTLSPSEVEGCKAILAAAEGLPISFVAYMLATAYHETATTMQPVKEANWLSPAAQQAYFRRMYDIEGARPEVARRLGNIRPGDGAKYPGMGYVQSTGRGNAARAQRELGLPIVDQPELLMRPDVAAQVMRRGMVEGWFTGKRLADYLPLRGFAAARRVINGTDKAEAIADHARKFQAALVAGEWQ